ncbi:MAG TPA: regulatory protein RecX [Steroidobacteraceae bacterium]|nr:regulatory protein RecX [Steroidobacteraceae bacterium]
MATSKRRDGPAAPRTAVDALDSRAARAAALDALARRDHASEDLRRKLLDKGYDPTVVAGVIERLCGEKLLDDRRYIESFVSYRAARGQGPHRVRADLRKIGLQGELVEQGLAAYGDWIDDLRRARQKKFGAQVPTHYADQQRQARFLGYRGFTGAQIRLALGFDTDNDVDT